MDPLPPLPPPTPQPPTGKGSMVTVEQALPMWKRNNQHVMNMGQKKFASQAGFEPMTSQTAGGCSIHLSYQEHMEGEAIY